MPNNRSVKMKRLWLKLRADNPEVTIERMQEITVSEFGYISRRERRTMIWLYG